MQHPLQQHTVLAAPRQGLPACNLSCCRSTCSKDQTCRAHGIVNEAWPAKVGLPAGASQWCMAFQAWLAWPRASRMHPMPHVHTTPYELRTLPMPMQLARVRHTIGTTRPTGPGMRVHCCPGPPARPPCCPWTPCLITWKRWAERSQLADCRKPAWATALDVLKAGRSGRR